MLAFTKKLYFLFINFCFLLQTANSQNYYYYQGNKISLEERTDKFAIVMNSYITSKEMLFENLNSGLKNVGGELKEAGPNVFLVDLENPNFSTSSLNIDNYISSITSENDKIKFVTPVYFGESQNVTQIPCDEFIARLKNKKQKEKLDILNAKYGIRIIGNVADEKGFLLKSNDNIRENALELSEIYRRTEIFEYVEPNFHYPESCIFHNIPNDEFFGQQWALKNTGQLVRTDGFSSYLDLPFVNGLPNADMDVDLAWDFTTGSPSVKVAVFDTGIDSTHPDLNSPGHILPGYDAYWDKNSVPADTHGHGTGTSGLIGAVMNNGIGTAGIANGCKIMLVKITTGPAATATNISLSRGFDTARVRGIDILSNSWGGVSPVTTITNAINNAATFGRNGLGCVITFSTGNEGHIPVVYPSNLPYVIAVGASTTHDQKKAIGTGNHWFWGGNYGENIDGDIDVVAPTNCYTTDVQGIGGVNTSPGIAGNYYSSYYGTSCSCPIAAGVAALILSINTSQTRLDVMEKLFRGCDKIDNVAYSTSKPYGRWNYHYGYGRVNAYNSVRLASGIDVTPPTINHLTVQSQTTTGPINITAEIVDQDGSAVPTIGINQPKVLFRINKNNAGYSGFDSVSAHSPTGNMFNFNLPCMGYETHVQYYIRANDVAGNTTYFPRGAPNNFGSCYFAVGTFTIETNKIGAFSAPDAFTPVVSPSAAFGSFKILNTNVTVYLRQNQVNDAIFELVSPISDANNNRKALFSRNGNGAGIFGTVISDSASQTWYQGFPPWSNGSVKGDYLLNGLNGTDANGNWKILYVDWTGGNGSASFDSIRISFKKSSGTLSSSIRFNTANDSILNFGTLNYNDSVTSNFYLKNVGTSNLLISNVEFTGIYFDNFTLLSSLPVNIVPGDSGLLVVNFKPNGENFDSTNECAVMNITNNDPHKSLFKVSLQVDSVMPLINDIQALGLIVPSNGAVLPSGSIITPQASFKNNGQNSQSSVTVRYKIINSGGTVVYNQTAIISSISSGQTQTATFPASSSLSTSGAYIIRAISQLAGDEVTANDSISGSITVSPLMNDIQALGLIVPSSGAVLPSGSIITPQASFKNNGQNSQSSVTVRYKIINSGGTVVYNQTVIISSISSGQTQTATFPASSSLSSSGAYIIRSISQLAGDEVTANDSISGSITVSPLMNDIQALGLIVPSNGAVLPSGSIITPQASFKNNGQNSQSSVTVRYKIINSGGTVVYNQTAIISSISSGQTQTATFPASSSLSSSGAYIIRAISQLAGDEVTANDSISGSITITPLMNDIQAFELLVPSSGAILSYGAKVNPKASFKNNGQNSQNNVTVSYKIINSGGTEVYNQSAIINSISSGQTRNITFTQTSSFVVAGTYTIRAISQLNGDQVKANDSLSGSIIISPQMSGLQFSGVSISYRSSIVTPQVSFKNKGPNSQRGISVGFRIVDSAGTVVYNQTSEVDIISSGKTKTLTFPGGRLPHPGTYEICSYSNALADEISETDTVINFVSDLPMLLLNIKLIPEGKYNTKQNILMSRDTIRLYLRNASSPFEVIDSSTGVIDSIGFSVDFSILTEPSELFYIVLKHYQCIEVWSKDGGEILKDDNLYYSYDFTTGINMAYGNNLKLKGNKYCIFSGDINQDQVIDLTDLNLIYNDITNFAFSHRNTDLNGDRYIDLNDILIAYNNSIDFIESIKP